MPGQYLHGVEPDPDDFFAQVVPAPPPTDRPGGMLFMAPFDPTLPHWFAYLRRGADVSQFQGSQESVRRWALAQDVAERWIYVTDRAAYVPLPEESGRRAGRR